MSSTYLSLHYHLVFSTKNREALIAPEWRARLHDYLGGTVRGLGGYPEGIGGVADHVRLLVGLKAMHCVSEVLRESNTLIESERVPDQPEVLRDDVPTTGRPNCPAQGGNELGLRAASKVVIHLDFSLAFHATVSGACLENGSSACRRWERRARLPVYL
jgi:hypothetical protein